MNGEVPSDTVELAVPFAAALHSALVDEVDTDNVVGCDTVVLDVAVQLLASVTTTEYVFAERPVMFAVVAPLLHA